MEYKANFYVSNGTTLCNPIIGTNKAKLIKDIRTMAEGNRLPNTRCKWQVTCVLNNFVTIVAEGGMNNVGKRYRINCDY